MTMVLPLTYFQLNASYEGIVADTGDPGLSPEFFNVYMDLTLTPRIENRAGDDQILLSTLNPPVTALLVPIPASIQNGVLVLPRQTAPSDQTNDTTQSSIPGLRLLAKSALLNIGANRLLYDVKPGATTIYGNQYLFDSFTFAAPEVDPPMPYLVSVLGAPSSGTFLATVVTSTASGTTTALAKNASAVTVQTALAALPAVGVGNVAVAGADGGPYTVAFSGALAGQPVGLTVNGSGLIGGTNASIVADPVVSTILDLTTVARVTV